MKNTHLKISVLLAACLVAIGSSVGLGGADTTAAPKITWMNDDIRPKVEEERRQQKDNPRLYYLSAYNLVTYRVCGKNVELGLRADGVCVWREAP